MLWEFHCCVCFVRTEHAQSHCRHSRWCAVLPHSNLQLVLRTFADAYLPLLYSIRRNVWFKSFACFFLTGLFASLLIFQSSVHILLLLIFALSPLSDMCFATVSPILWVVFSLMASFGVQTFLMLMGYSLLFLVLSVLYLKNHCTAQGHKDLLPFISFRILAIYYSGRPMSF